MNYRSTLSLILALTLPLLSCGKNVEDETVNRTTDKALNDSLSQKEQQASNSTRQVRSRSFSPEDIRVEKALLFDEYTLDDSYPYKDATRVIKWNKIKSNLALIENARRSSHPWGVLQNYKNLNREAPVVYNFHRNEYKLVSDSLGIARYQSAPLYALGDSIKPRRYGRDGTPVTIKDSVGGFYRLSLFESDEEWMVPKRYVLVLPEDTDFRHAIFVDRSDQNIVTMEQEEAGKWLVRSVNPCTTGKHNPPYQMETPLGTFLLQEKKVKMYYTHDGSSKLAGYAPYASRFDNGGYLHGVPSNNPNGKMIEYSRSLGTTPRSHMCVRNATSHAKFIYDNMPTLRTLVVVID